MDISAKEYELKYFSAGVDSLEEYLFSKELYWQLGVVPPRDAPPFPALTLGNILLSRTKALASLDRVEQRDLFELSDQKFQYIHIKWRSAWEKKAEQEIKARLSLWQTFLEEYSNAPSANSDRYPYEVRRRVMITLLADDIGFMASPDQEILAGLDKTLHTMFVPDEFIWESKFAPAFPKDKFPYLYGKLRD